MPMPILIPIPTPPMHILISGAGIAGPTLAWFLARANMSITIVEKTATHRRSGQNIDVNGSAVTILERMGLLPAVRALNTTEKGTQIVDSAGHPFARFPVSGPSPTNELEILRGDLAGLVYDATKDDPRITYRFGTTVESVVESAAEDDAVRVTLSTGQTLSVDALVAADGQWSPVRKMVFPPSALHLRHLGLYLAYFSIPRVPHQDTDWWTVYSALHSRGLNTRPDPHGTIRAMLTKVPRGAAEKAAWRAALRADRKAQMELLRKEFGDAGWQAARLLDEMERSEDYYFHEVSQVKLATWSRGRVVCVGDAAYAPTPISGMGTSLAIDGAYVLAGELSRLKTGDHPRDAFAAYERKFRPFVERIQQIPAWAPGLVHPQSAWGRWVLQTVFWVVAKGVAVPWVARLVAGADGAKEGGKKKDDDFPLEEYEAFGLGERKD